LAEAQRLNINSRDSSLRTPLMIAINFGGSHNGGAKFLEFLLKQTSLDFDARDRSGKTALTYAVEKENLQMAKILLPRMKMTKEEKKNILDSLYILSSSKGCAKVCSFIKSQMSKVDLSVAQKSFDSAVNEWKFEFALELAKEHKLNLNSKDSSQRTPLMIAINFGGSHNGGDKLIDFLITQSNLEIHHTDRSGKTALSYAIEKGKAEAVQKLRQLGAR
jgi:ankyrin repeat protein